MCINKCVSYFTSGRFDPKPRPDSLFFVVVLLHIAPLPDTAWFVRGDRYLTLLFFWFMNCYGARASGICSLSPLRACVAQC